MKAVIFDLDGVIIDSCNLWKQAEYEVFSSVGVKLSDELCKITENMTTIEVTRFWFDRNPWQGKSLAEIEKAVIKRVARLVEEELQILETSGHPFRKHSDTCSEIIRTVIPETSGH
jgi:sugar-phosphatase